MRDPEPDTLWGATSWSLVARAAGEGSRDDVDQAWVRLIEKYKDPVARGISRILRGHPETEEVLAEFPGYVMEREVLLRADRDRGRFRCYLQGVLRRFVLEALRKRDARAGADVAELELPAPPDRDADHEDEAAWAEAVLSNATRRYLAGGSRDAQVLLRIYGVPPFEEAEDRQALCAEFGLTRNALNQVLHRGRQELRCLILDEVKETVAGPGELHDEMVMVVRRLMEARPGLIQAAERT